MQAHLESLNLIVVVVSLLEAQIFNLDIGRLAEQGMPVTLPWAALQAVMVAELTPEAIVKEIDPEGAPWEGERIRLRRMIQGPRQRNTA